MSRRDVLNTPVIQVTWRIGIYAVLLMPVWLSAYGVQGADIVFVVLLSTFAAVLYLFFEPAISIFGSKECPFCYSEIDERASVCMHCNREIKEPE